VLWQTTLHARRLAMQLRMCQSTQAVSCNVQPGPNRGLVFECVEQEAMKLLEKQSVWENPVQATL
jgi:hypothetical protein